MKTTKQIIWETKKELFNRIWEKGVGTAKDPIEGAMLIMRELNKVRQELEDEVRSIK